MTKFCLFLNSLILFLLFCVWYLMLKIMFVSSIHFNMCSCGLFALIAEHFMTIMPYIDFFGWWTEHAGVSTLGLLRTMLPGVPVVAQWIQIRLRNHEVAGLIPGLLSGLRIWRCHELRCRSQMWLGVCVAVTVTWAGRYSSN